MGFTNALDCSNVAVVQGGEGTLYPKTAPFRPHVGYPEFGGLVAPGLEINSIYSLCRRLFVSLGFDKTRFDSHGWNPLGEIVKPGMKVLLKPNLVRHLHMRGGEYQAVVTHASVVRCVLDYVALALKGDGEILVGDAPVQGADFSKILSRTGLQEVCDDVAKTWNMAVKIVDFRLTSVELDEDHREISSNQLSGDLEGYCSVDLGKGSLLIPLAAQCDRFRVTNYNCREMAQHHNQDVNEYLIPKSVLRADVVINLPKLKTHRKVGLTAALKNLVGINGHKDWLPHHREGAVSEGGDEYLKASMIKKLKSNLEEKMLYQDRLTHKLSSVSVNVLGRMSKIIGNDPYEEGSWHGNDTVWRMVLDLNRALLYADQNGDLQDTPQRKCLTIVDAILAGEGEGPMEPDPVACAMLVGGCSSLAVDFALAELIGFDYRKIPLIANGFSVKEWPLVAFSPQEVNVKKIAVDTLGLVIEPAEISFRFTPPSGWKNHIELE